MLIIDGAPSVVIPRSAFHDTPVCSIASHSCSNTSLAVVRPRIVFTQSNSSVTSNWLLDTEVYQEVTSLQFQNTDCQITTPMSLSNKHSRQVRKHINRFKHYRNAADEFICLQPKWKESEDEERGGEGESTEEKKEEEKEPEYTPEAGVSSD